MIGCSPTVSISPRNAAITSGGNAAAANIPSTSLTCASIASRSRYLWLWKKWKPLRSMKSDSTPELTYQVSGTLMKRSNSGSGCLRMGSRIFCATIMPAALPPSRPGYSRWPMVWSRTSSMSRITTCFLATLTNGIWLER